MLTRLRVRGFKSLADAEATFGPFTCIAGANGVGKSNLFDAIQFLRDLAEYPIIEAAARVRDPQGRTGDLTAIFTHDRDGRRQDLHFDADFIVPETVKDDFNRDAKPTATFLRYRLSLRYAAASEAAPERIELVSEALTYVPKSEARARLGFPTLPAFRDSVIKNTRRGAHYISTEPDGEFGSGTSATAPRTIKLHQDGGSSGRPFQVPAAGSPRTVMAGINTHDYPTVLAARREMQSWQLLQLEPSALRQPDGFSAEARVSSNGAHLPATLLRLKSEADVSNQLAELLEDVGAVSVERDESRRTNTLFVTGRDRVPHPARSLSDGTLRFLALAIMASDPHSGRLLCLEEPENGIHPSRIPAILALLQDIAADARLPVDDSNPLRQVIINTHSPVVVAALKLDDLLMTRLARQGRSAQTLIECVAGSWRAQRDFGEAMMEVPPGALADYVNRAFDAPPVQSVATGTLPAARTVATSPSGQTTVSEYMRQLELDLAAESSP